MNRCRVEVEQTKRTYVEFDADDDADGEEIRAIALEEAELADWEEEPPEIVSIEIVDQSA